MSNTEKELLLRQLIGDFRSHTQFPSEGSAVWGWLPGVGWSDHWAFWEEGLPAIMVTDTALYRYPAHHTSADTPEKIDYLRMARVVSGLKRVIEDFANQPKGAKY